MKHSHEHSNTNTNTRASSTVFESTRTGFAGDERATAFTLSYVLTTAITVVLATAIVFTFLTVVDTHQQQGVQTTTDTTSERVHAAITHAVTPTDRPSAGDTSDITQRVRVPGPIAVTEYELKLHPQDPGAVNAGTGDAGDRARIGVHPANADEHATSIELPEHVTVDETRTETVTVTSDTHVTVHTQHRDGDATVWIEPASNGEQ